MHQRKGFTLIELLVVITIIAILSVVVVLALNPAEMLRQGRDQSRLSDMDILNHAIALFQTDQAVVNGTSSLGTPNTIYLSLPDLTLSGNQTSTCASLGLSTPPGGYSYQCTSPQSYRNVNGTGWIPINFTKLSTGSPISTLPVDPANSSSSGLYYTYVVGGNLYEVTAGIESQKYGTGGTNDVIANDGGSLPNTYEKGPGVSQDLEPINYGYVATSGGGLSSQTIIWAGSVPGQYYGNAPFDFTSYANATASSGLTVSYSASGVCTLSGTVVTLTGAGICTLTANQAGNGSYSAAAPQNNAFIVNSTLLATRGPSKMSLNWNSYTGAAMYQIYDSTDSVTFFNVSSTSMFAYTVTGLTNGTRYWFYVAPTGLSLPGYTIQTKIASGTPGGL